MTLEPLPQIISVMDWIAYRTIDRRTFTTTAIAFFLRPNLDARQAIANKPAPDDASAIYSLILAARCSCCQDTKGKWLIDDHTYASALPIIEPRSETSMEAARRQAASDYQPTITPPADFRKEADALVADLKQKLAEPIPIKANLNLPSRYQLITPEENRQYFLLHSQSNVYNPDFFARAGFVPQRYVQEFAGAYGVISLSPIGFNTDRTLALFSYRQIGGSCGDESWHILGRSSSKEDANGWSELKWGRTGTGWCD